MDLESGRSLRTLEGHTSGSLRGDDLRRTRSWRPDKTLRIWDLESGEACAPSKAILDHCRGCDPRRAPRRLGVGGQNAAGLGPGERESLRTLEGHTNQVTAVAVTSDGRRAVSASWDKTLRIWDLESGKACAPSKVIPTTWSLP